jgi:pyruvate-formate lyase-activating enzyme
VRSSSEPSTERRSAPSAEVHGTVFDVQRFALHDGPGIRTTVFLKGCPLQCGWCENPESWLGALQLAVRAGACPGCDECRRAVPGSTSPLPHEPLCPALHIIGRVAKASQIIDEVLRDSDYYAASGGGLTLSGGEPLAQPVFAATLLRLAHEAGIHTCLDTSGYASDRTIVRMVGLVDLWLYDVKATGDRDHRRLTGVGAGRILRNLERLLTMGERVRLRIPLVPGVNDTDEHLGHVARIAASHPELDGIDVFPYHAWGVEKAPEVGATLPYAALPTTSREAAADLVTRLHRLGCTAAQLG